MITVDFKNKTLPLLGLGTMRFPLKDGSTNAADIDEDKVADMIAYAMENGVNYFDTAYPYHASQSEIVLGKILKDYPREAYYLATKFPGHQILSSYDPEAVFEDQLKKCGVEYFDFYLLHNVYEDSIKIYNDERWGIIDFFVKQKELGRIKHLGFSSHGGCDLLREFLSQHGDKMEFCQIQLNYVDWSLQDAKIKCDILKEYDIPVWVMEPVRGGKLANLSNEAVSMLKSLNSERTNAEWAFRWLQGIDNVKMILSGMSNMEQLLDNTSYMKSFVPLTEEEKKKALMAGEMINGAIRIPCTACQYCTADCPMNIAIPEYFALYNQKMREDVEASSASKEAYRDLCTERGKASDCIECGQCESKCPQHIEIVKWLKDVKDTLEV